MVTRTKRKLNDRQVKNAKAQPKTYRLPDGDGLFLEVTPSGSKIWRMRANLNKKEMILTFGNYPVVLLAQARKNCEEARSYISQGIDPRQVKKAAEAAEQARNDNTFEKIARNWHTSKLPEWKENTARWTFSLLRRDILPYIGDIPISDITHQQIVDILETIQKRSAIDAAKKAKTTISSVFKYAIQRGMVKYNPVNDLESVIQKTTVKHFAAITHDELPDFLKALDRNDIRMFISTRVAINLMLLLFLRTSELIEAEWSEIDLENGVWIVPWQRMKMGKRKINPDKTDHRIDLPRQAIALLKEQYQYSGNRQHVFPGMREPRKPMSNGAILMALRRLGYQNRMTGHGFRALAASALGELGFRREVIERALAHKEKDQVQAAYHRADFQQERKEMLQAWADYIDTIRRKNSIRLVA
ncbi:MAG: tyrosine-type recombinase/integrase [Oxalobacter sp.]|nr:tyrosine-type recombinase/integrase [Oxalobacter sp.]